MLPIYASAAFPALPTSTATPLPTPTPTPWATALQLPSLCFTKFHFTSVRFGFVFISSSAAWHKRNEWYEKGQQEEEEEWQQGAWSAGKTLQVVWHQFI